MGAEIPQAAGLFFPDRIERPTEAPIVALEKKPRHEELKRTARLASKKYSADLEQNILINQNSTKKNRLTFARRLSPKKFIFDQTLINALLSL